MRFAAQLRRLSPMASPSRAHTSHAENGFAAHLLKARSHISTVQELLGLPDVATTTIYTHVLRMGASAVCSPLVGRQ
jgi:site-specific recombinase XerD